MAEAHALAHHLEHLSALTDGEQCGVERRGLEGSAEAQALDRTEDDTQLGIDAGDVGQVAVVIDAPVEVGGAVCIFDREQVRIDRALVECLGIMVAGRRQAEVEADVQTVGDVHGHVEDQVVLAAALGHERALRKVTGDIAVHPVRADEFRHADIVAVRAVAAEHAALIGREDVPGDVGIVEGAVGLEQVDRIAGEVDLGIGAGRDGELRELGGPAVDAVSARIEIEVVGLVAQEAEGHRLDAIAASRVEVERQADIREIEPPGIHLIRRLDGAFSFAGIV